MRWYAFSHEKTGRRTYIGYRFLQLIFCVLCLLFSKIYLNPYLRGYFDEMRRNTIAILRTFLILKIKNTMVGLPHRRPATFRRIGEMSRRHRLSDGYYLWSLFTCYFNRSDDVCLSISHASQYDSPNPCFLI